MDYLEPPDVSQYNAIAASRTKSFTGKDLDFSAWNEESEALAERLWSIGGKSCDCCKKTLEELGVTTLDCCSRCLKAYYCSKSCARKQWRAGHKQACRKKGEIKPGDVMRLQAEVLGNNFIPVIVVGPAVGEEGMWRVNVLSEDLKPMDAHNVPPSPPIPPSGAVSHSSGNLRKQVSIGGIWLHLVDIFAYLKARQKAINTPHL